MVFELSLEKTNNSFNKNNNYDLNLRINCKNSNIKLQEIYEYSKESNVDEYILTPDKTEYDALKTLKKTQAEQGFIGKAWDGFKNFSNIGIGSDKAKNAINDFNSGFISEDEMNNIVLSYKEGQKQCVDIAADIVSGIGAFGTYALSTGIGIAASPFTGGASLGLIALGFGLSGVIGAGTKAAVKKLDSVSGDREYDSLKYDIATGGINGIFAPVSAGIGGAAGKFIAQKVGVTAVRESGKISLKNSLNDNIQGKIVNTFLTTNMNYTGGTMKARVFALGTDLAVNGTIAGSVDSSVRYLASDSENKSTEGLLSDVKTGALGGLFLSPVLGGSMKAIGHIIGNYTGYLQSKVSKNYDTAKNALLNNKTVENPNIENINSFFLMMKDLENLYSLNSGINVNNLKKIENAKINTEDFYSSLKILGEHYNKTGLNLWENISRLQSSANNQELNESLKILQNRLNKLILSENFVNMTREQKLQAVIENTNIFFSKFAQTYSTDESLSPEVLKLLKQFTSKCMYSRNINQARQLADELYGKGKYTIEKSFGAGTIGETYLAKTKDGKEVVIKMLKEGVDSDRLAQDRKMLVNYIKEFETNSKEKEYKLNFINGMFDAWDKEINLELETLGAKEMADGAKRYSVAQTIDKGKKNRKTVSIVMEKAKGIRLDELLTMIKLYKESPSKYLKQYKDIIKNNPALKNPESWLSDLSLAYQKAQNEQMMFIGKSGTKTVHADPHAGNIFIDFDSKSGKPKITYIDTGNVIKRTNSQTLQDLALSVNMMIGNSKGVADSLLDGAILPKGADKDELSKKIAELLDERLFKAGININNTKNSQNVINGIFKELNIVQNEDKSNYIKCAIQRINTERAINDACNKVSDNSQNIKDLAKGILKSLKINPKETIKTIKPIIKWAYENNDQAMITFFQVIIKEAELQK